MEVRTALLNNPLITAEEVAAVLKVSKEHIQMGE